MTQDLLPLLKKTFGYDTFRPYQQEIIAAWLENRDVFALLPTGGGKSLCFQLPALVRPGLTVVVSPLIALMKDQVDSMESVGVAATYLNSTLGEDEARRRLRGLHQGEFKLLYVAPERLLLDGWAENLRNWNVTGIAIDEAHCVSDWGHDFRPEYRQLAGLRRVLPGVPMMALTATATDRVRRDVIEQLGLRNPGIFASSFNRPNLTYRVLPKDKPLHQILQFVHQRPDESGIIYCSSRASTERLADSLASRGLKAVAYHAGLEANDRNRRQEAFLRDDAKIVCATIAFGMGINKPNVRWVIHHDLPKNVEGYYQETGRAGRDGLPGECVLLYSAGDAAKQRHFIDEITDEKEQAVAIAQLRRILQYAESPGCRRADLLGYFGEQFPLDSCGACDNCVSPRELYDATIPAQKFLSCVHRIRAASGFSVGLNHIADVLVGADSDKIRRWGHDALSTHGIGKELSAKEWVGIGRELVRQGYAELAPGEYPTIDIAEKGRSALRSREKISLIKPMAVATSGRRRWLKAPAEAAANGGGTVDDANGGPLYDEILFERLRGLRKKLADDRNVPAYIILGDASLRAMARSYPITLAGMQGIPGIGEKKKADFGQIFADAIASYLRENPKIALQSA